MQAYSSIPNNYVHTIVDTFELLCGFPSWIHSP
jgi:hypothetical protein